jgi:two-component system sensor kinase FixL
MLAIAGGMLIVLVWLEWYFQFEFSLGVLYVFPVMTAATALNRWQSFLTALVCAWTRGLFVPPTSPVETVLRFVMASIAYAGCGLLVVEMSRNRRRVLQDYARIQLEQNLRRRAEEQLRLLVESSPTAIFTLDARARVLAANRTAHELLGFPNTNSLLGESIEKHIPLFVNALRLSPGARQVHTSATSWATRLDGSLFPITTWFSTYGEGAQRCLAAIVVDVSEEMRDREQESFRQLLDYNRLLAGAVSHEIRNMCSAISVVSSNLGRRPELASDADFQALNSLVNGLTHVASFELSHRSGKLPLRAVDLQNVFDQLRVVVESDWQEVGGRIVWEIPEHKIPVYAEPHGLLQVFLNLAQNSLRAVGESAEKELSVRVASLNGDLSIQFSDSGPGVSRPDDLFHPFRPGADGSGLGLYISRALAHSFGGDLLYVPTERGCRFDVVLRSAATPNSTGPEQPAYEPPGISLNEYPAREYPSTLDAH